MFFKTTLFYLKIKCDDFDQSKKAEFSFYCDSNCDDDDSPAVVTLDVGACQSYSDHCAKNPTSINIFTSYNVTTEMYTFNASIPSNPQCNGGWENDNNPYPTINVKCGQCFTFMNGQGKAELRCSSASSLSISILLISLIVLICSLVL